MAGKFAVVCPQYVSTFNPEQWTLFEVGRETPAQIYRSATPVPQRHREVFRHKRDVMGLFDTREEAVSFIKTSCDVWTSYADEVERLSIIASDAMAAVAVARNARNNAVRALCK